MRKKQIMEMVLTLVMCFALSACGSSDTVESPSLNESLEESADEEESTGIERSDTDEEESFDRQHSDSDALETENNTDYGISNLPLEMRMSVTSVKDGVATVLFDNQSGYVMTYSEYFSLQKEVDGKWESVPAKEDAAVRDIAYELKDLETGTLQIDLKVIFGSLEAGNYRLIQDDMVAEFSLAEASDN